MTMRLFSGIMAILFVGFAVVQCNDPDPYIWVPIYLFPAVVSAIISIGRKISPLLILLGSTTFFVGGFFQWPAHWEGVALKNGMKNINIEEGREALGLLICAVSLFIYWIYLTQFKVKMREV